MEKRSFGEGAGTGSGGSGSGRRAQWALSATLALVGVVGMCGPVRGLFGSDSPVLGGSGSPVAVTLENFVRAESDRQFARAVKAGAFGTLVHSRKQNPALPRPEQIERWQDRDTLESIGVFDLAAAPVTVTLPDPAGRYLSLQAVSEDHYTLEVAYAPGTYTYTQERVGTRYVWLRVRTLAASERSTAREAAGKIQDQIRVEQSSKGKFEVPRWDENQLAALRSDLAQRALPERSGEMFGKAGEVDPERHLLGTAREWGGLPRRDAVRFDVRPKVDDGQTVHVLTFREVPVDGFWSITVYDSDGYLVPKDLGFYNLTSASTVPNRDGSFTIQFGGCRRLGSNCLQISPGWTYSVRLYRPRPEILDGRWLFPQAKPILPPKP